MPLTPVAVPAIEAALPALRRFALHLVDDDDGASELVDRVVDEARRQLVLTPAQGDVQAFMFRLMRTAFHSVELRRLSAPGRGDSPSGVRRGVAYTFPRRDL